MLRTRTPDELLAHPHPRPPGDGLRIGVVLVGLAAAAGYAYALSLTFYLEPTTEALEDADRGATLLYVLGPLMVVLALLGPFIGTRWWTSLMVVPAPFLTTVIYLVNPEGVFSYLSALCLSPIAFIGALLGVAMPRLQPWPSQPGRTSASTPATPTAWGASGPRHSA